MRDSELMVVERAKPAPGKLLEERVGMYTAELLDAPAGKVWYSTAVLLSRRAASRVLSWFRTAMCVGAERCFRRRDSEAKL